MATERILVLASSRKLGGRCIAGLSLSGNGLVRPVSASSDGELLPSDHQLVPPPAEFDVVTFDHLGFADDPTQPENLLIDGEPWDSEGPMAPAAALPLIEEHLHTASTIFVNHGKAVPAHVAEEGMDASLCVVEPDSLDFVVTPQILTRVEFVHGGHLWDLPISDYRVRPAMRTQPTGRYSLDDLGLGDPDRIMLLLSLAAKHNDWHSKLVAGVLQFP
ncbi:MAG: hypothetical protein QOH76_1560 [Thermoleophilaceae bacterium]|jgi:hypothetical protein|nr:hypothetical protein [Thermoleophilaceae bacterium]